MLTLRFRLNGERAAVRDRKVTPEEAVRHLDERERDWRETMESGFINYAVSVDRQSPLRLVVVTETGDNLVFEAS